MLGSITDGDGCSLRLLLVAVGPRFGSSKAKTLPKPLLKPLLCWFAGAFSANGLMSGKDAINRTCGRRESGRGERGEGSAKWW